MCRMSHLPIAEKCGGSTVLSAQHGAGRAAAMSKAFHATCAGADVARFLMAALSPDEQDEVRSWQKPADVFVNEWVMLDYASSEKELEVGLDSWGEYADNEADALTWGHLDFAWVRELDGHRIAFVADIKKSIWTTPDGPDSLQLHAYGRAYAKKNGCTAYCTGIWAAEEGEWLWSKDMYQLQGGAKKYWDRIAYAATNSGEYSFGDHCRNCHARIHCPEYFIAPEAAVGELAPFAGDKSLVTSEIANKLLLDCERAIKSAEFLQTEVKELVRRGHLKVLDSDGRYYGPVRCPGRKRIDADKLEALLPGREAEYTKRGEAYDQFRWLKVKAAPKKQSA